MNPYWLRTGLLAGLCLLVVILGGIPPVHAQTVSVIDVPLDGVKTMTITNGIDRVVTGDSRAVRVRVINSRDIIIFGLNKGVTTLHVWTDAGIQRYFLNVKSLESPVDQPGPEQTTNLLRKIEEGVGDGQELRVFTPQYRDVESFRGYIERLLKGEGEILFADPTAKKIFVAGPPELLEKIENLLSRIDVPGEDVKFTRRIDLENRPVKEMLDKVNAMLTESGKAIIDEETNSILVVDNVSKVEQITQFLNSIDVRTVSQVRIEAKFVEIDDDARERIGLDWDVETGDLTTELEVGPSGINGLQLDVVNPDINATIELLEEKDIGNLISSPNVMTRNQQEAVLEVVNEQSYVAGWNVSQTQNSTNVTPIVETVEGGITLTVTPLIGQSEVIQLDVEPALKVVNLGQAINQIANGNSFPFFTPTVDRRTATLNVALKDGQTLVIGGLDRSETDQSREQAPFLGDIPILGHLFRSRDDQTTSRNITIFLTAEIVRLREGQEEAASASDTAASVVNQSDTVFPEDVPSSMQKQSP